MAKKEGMVQVPVDLEGATIEVNLDLANDEVMIGAITAAGTRLLVKGVDDGTGKARLEVVTFGAAPLIPGTTITTPADTVVGIGATVALPVPPAGTTRMTVQNNGPAATQVKVRETPGGAGDGPVLVRFGSITFGSPGGSIDALEVEEVAGIATTVSVTFEGP